MNLIKPKKLQIGDKIRIIAPSGPVEADKIELAKTYFEQKGYKVELGKHLYSNLNYLAGNDSERLEDLHEAFNDDETKAIICARGGYGALRLIDKIDYELIKKNPKIFCGYSDITVLNIMFYQKANLITFSGPMAQSDFGNEICTFTEDGFFKVMDGEPLSIPRYNSIVYNSGDAEGIIIGGNLSTITSLCGRDFVPDSKFMLLVEDLNEPVYKIDRYFTQLLAIPKFKTNITAILLGEFLNIDNQDYLKDFFRSLSKELNIPIISGYPISHSKTKETVPIGAYGYLKDCVLEIKNYTA